MSHRVAPLVALLWFLSANVACATHAKAGAGEAERTAPFATVLQPTAASSSGVEMRPLAVDQSASVDRSPSAPGPPRCPAEMLLVEGDYCTEVRQECLTWADPPANPFARCTKFAPSVCAGERVRKRFCVDQDEYARPGDSLPLGDASWDEARRVCEEQSKRLCKETEWEFACEGEQMFPYPTGYDRDAIACNVDKLSLVDVETGKLRDLREPASEVDRCRSPFGVRSMSGNVDEWVWRDRTKGEWRSALKGGWWMPARDRCRPATTVHDEHFHGVQTGVRCCADAPLLDGDR